MNAPKRGKKYKEIVLRGCGYKHDSFNGDGDCEHGYEWDCDYCPCTIEYQRRKSNDDGGGSSFEFSM